MEGILGKIPCLVWLQSRAQTVEWEMDEKGDGS